MTNPYLSVESKPGKLLVHIHGDWIFDNVLALEEAAATVLPDPGQAVVFQCSGLHDIDIAGAWVLYDCSENLSVLGIRSGFEGFRARHFKFLQGIIDAAAIREYEEPGETPTGPGYVRLVSVSAP